MKDFYGNFQVGDIVLFRTIAKLTKPLTWLAPIIRFIVRTKYNHAGVVWKDDAGNMCIVEATEHGVIQSPIAKINSPKYSSVEVRRYPEFGTMYLARVSRRIHWSLQKKYDFGSLFFFQLIYQVTNLWIGRKRMDAGDRFYCTELVAYAHKEYFAKWWLTDHNDLRRYGTMVYRRDNKIVM
jgi:hypothetical protein